MKKALEDCDFLAIRDYCLDPDGESLSESQRIRLDRIRAAGKFMNKYPHKKQVVNLLRTTFQISETQAKKDLDDSMYIFNIENKFNYEWWHNWALENIADLIQSCRNAGDRSNWAKAQKNLLAALGEPPKTNIDPKLMEKHNIYYQISVNNQIVNIDIRDLGKLPKSLIDVIKPTLFQEIDESQANDIMNT
jgi:hypothetical protein